MTDNTTPTAWLWTNPDGSREVTFVDPALDRSPSTVLALELGRVPVPLAPVDADRAARAGDAEPVAWLTRDDEGSPAMLFFDPLEAENYCDINEEPEPLYAAPQATERGQEPMTRFCPGCGSVGEVGSEFRDCCPDGNEARVIPEKLANKCRELFHLAVDGALAASREGGA